MKRIQRDIAKDITETVKTALATMEGLAKNTKQLVKAKILPIWSDQKFDR